MKMRTAKDFELYLTKRGYKPGGSQFLDSHIVYLDFFKPDTQGHVTLFVGYTDEYLQELEKLDPGVEFEIDYSKVEVTGAYIKTLITYPETCRAFSKDRTGIVIEGEEFKEYFEKALWISENPAEHELNIIEQHYRNLKYFIRNFKPILIKYNFYECYDSFWDINERHSSMPRFDYRHVNTKSDFDADFIYETNILTGKLQCCCLPDIKEDLCTLSPEEFEKRLIEYMKNDSLSLKFDYIFDKDPNHTKDSYIEILKLVSAVRYLEGKKFCEFYTKEDIDFSKIPEKDKELVERYNKSYEKRGH